MSHIEAVTDANFDAHVLKAGLPVLVDFWAEWCGPCRALTPIVEEISAEMAGRLLVVKMNVDENPATPNTFGIRSIPTLILFKDGGVVDQRVGGSNKAALVAWINSALRD
ncbi:MAG: thioredoxin [Alphaproteobacteria bacterium]|nr:MAG: thioredoxin [Alphaproteobacteria bacterium]